jgi:hypothetical protein
VPDKSGEAIETGRLGGISVSNVYASAVWRTLTIIMRVAVTQERESVDLGIRELKIFIIVVLPPRRLHELLEDKT